jgi:hypothetical protein
LTEYNKSNLEILLNTALSNALMDLDPLKNSYSNSDLTLEIEILEWMLDIVQKMSHNLNFLKELVKNEINNFKVEYYYGKDIEKIDKLSKSIEILQTCLFLISMELDFHHLNSINGRIKRNINFYV